MSNEMGRQLQQIEVNAVAAMQRVAAEHATPRVDLQGQVLPARLPTTATAFEAGAASLRHVEVIARLLPLLGFWSPGPSG